MAGKLRDPRPVPADSGEITISLPVRDGFHGDADPMVAPANRVQMVARGGADRLFGVACAMLKSRSVSDPKLTAKIA